MKLTLTFHKREHFLERMAFYADRWNWEKPMVVKIDELRRLEEQSRKFHAMLNDISKQIPWAGAMRPPEQWKNLLVSAHAIATKNETEVVQGIEGEAVNVRESTSEMTIRRMASLIEYTHAFAAGHGVKFRAPDYYDDVPEAHRAYR